MAADGEACSGGCVCACVLGLDCLRFRAFCPITPALQCLGFITGAGGLPRRLGCMCAVRVHITPAVGALLPCPWLVPLWHRVRCDVLV